MVQGGKKIKNDQPEDIDAVKGVYQDLQKKLQVFFDSLVKDKINLELQFLESKKFKLAVEHANEQVAITDPEGTIIFANKAWENISGWTFNEVAGKKATDLWGAGMPPEFYQRMWGDLKAGKSFKNEIIYSKKTGEKFVAETNVAPVLDNDGQIQFFVFIDRDITREKEINNMKTEFVSLTSHQLRTPLTGIKWFAEILLRNKGKNLTAEQVDFLTQIVVSNNRMITLIDDLLNISHLETGRKFQIVKTRFKVKELADDVTRENIALITEKKIKIVNEIADNVMILADHDKLRQVWLNLISNAVKYSKAGGTITISSHAEDQQIAFIVRDQGIGIPLDQQKRVFEKFFRADNAARISATGTGLGLYLAKALVEAHGGQMWFESKENVGTNFYFILPER